KKKAEVATAGEMGGAMVAPPSKSARADKSVRAERSPAQPGGVEAQSSETAGDFPPGAQLCGKCNSTALVLLDGCQTCLNCGYSKCG
ncbi:MAG: NrdJb, partial [Rhodanobacteraceae bacterium]